MNKFIIFGCFLSIFGYSQEFKPINKDYLNNVVSAIYKAENSKKFPFGIKSISTGGDYFKAKKICENTVRNNYIRWQKSGKTNDFVEFLGRKYAPIGVSNDPGNLNSNWIKNVRYFLSKE